MNYGMANKGRTLEELVKRQNDIYRNKDIALVHKISVPWVVLRKGKKIVSAFPEGKSTLDFRGVIQGTAIAFDCKETNDNKGLPLANIPSHQIEYIEEATKHGEICFLVVYSSKQNKYYFVLGSVVLAKYQLWILNKGKRGYNHILWENMTEIYKTKGNILDYLQMFKAKEV